MYILLYTKLGSVLGKHGRSLARVKQVVTVEFLEAIPNLVNSIELVNALGNFGQNRLAVGDQQVQKPFIFFNVVGDGVALSLNWVFNTGIVHLQFVDVTMA